MRRATLVVLAVLGAWAVVSVPGTTAAFTDAPTTKTGTFAAATISAPSSIGCTNELNHDYVDLAWTASPNTGYRVTLWDANNTDYVTLAVLPAGTSSYRLDADAATQYWMDLGYQTVYVRGVAGGNWISNNYATRRINHHYDLWGYNAICA